MTPNALRVAFALVCLIGATAQGTTAATAPGALIKLQMSSKVGVLLDEIPAGSLREAAATDALAQPASFWRERAERQIRLTNYRLVFRGDFYTKARGPLPLPPKPVWTIDTEPARRATLGGHDLVLVDYDFATYILTDSASPKNVEPKLGKVGGKWDEPFQFPVDPELMLQRTGYACMDEDEYPVPSVFEENAYYFYDQTCEVETLATQGCHFTEFPTESCADAVARHVGRIDTKLHFTRVPWDAALADTVRVGTITNPNGADLSVFVSDMVEENRSFYRFFESGACELEEGVIGQSGWRRILTFSASVQNNGTDPIHIGDLTDPNNPWLLSNVFAFSACHGHYHFSHYGTFSYADLPGLKQAFCLEETNRYHNDEGTPLTAEHQSCTYQGIGRGWGDEYQFGLPGQWVDVTDARSDHTGNLTFDSNPDHFMCEGAPVLDSSGKPIFDPTEFTNSQGDVVSRMRCDLPSTWHDDNVGSVPVRLPTEGESFVTEPCTRGQTGPNRDCGYTYQTPLKNCTPGSTVNLSCKTNGPTQVLRICEKSHLLGVGVACTMRDSIANEIVGSHRTAVRFSCPQDRDAAAGNGGYSVYTAPIVASQAAVAVTCTGW